MLYKYRNFWGGGDIQVRDIVNKRELYLSQASRLNDDYDCYPVITIPHERHEIELALSRMMEQHPEYFPREDSAGVLDAYFVNNCELLKSTLDGAAKEVRQKIGVLSMSLSSEIPLLWQRYSDDFRGVCFGFRNDERGENFLSLAKPVSYSEERPSFEWCATFSTTEQEKFLLQKTCDWAYEQEARLVSVGRWGAKEYPADALKEVVFGERCSANNRRRVQGWIHAAGHQVEFFVASLDGGRERITPLNL